MPGQRVRGRNLPEAESFSVVGCPKEMENVLQFYYFTTYLLFSKNVLSGIIYNNAVVKYHWATVCKTVRPMLSERCLYCVSVCYVGILWPNGCMDQDVTRYRE